MIVVVIAVIVVMGVWRCDAIFVEKTGIQYNRGSECRQTQEQFQVLVHVYSKK
jgi:hypothetical protein